MTDEELKKLNEVRDDPKDTDILREEYAEGNGGKLAEKYTIKVRNQYSQTSTYKACSCYGLTAIYNGYQLREYDNNGLEFEQEDPRWKRETFQAERGYLDSGVSLQAMMTFFKNRGLIDGYVKCTTAQECINALNNGYLIYTGSSKCSWSKTKANKEFTYDANGASHCFAIINCDDTGFIAINSFGTARGDSGFFHIDYDKYEYLFSTYAIIDHDDTGKLDELVYNAQYQKAIELGITNGTDPDGTMTRKQGAVMNYRVYKMLKG